MSLRFEISREQSTVIFSIFVISVCLNIFCICYLKYSCWRCKHRPSFLWFSDELAALWSQFYICCMRWSLCCLSLTNNHLIVFRCFSTKRSSFSTIYRAVGGLRNGFFLSPLINFLLWWWRVDFLLLPGQAVWSWMVVSWMFCCLCTVIISLQSWTVVPVFETSLFYLLLIMKLIQYYLLFCKIWSWYNHSSRITAVMILYIFLCMSWNFLLLPRQYSRFIQIF